MSEEYKRLDYSKLKFKPALTSTQESLKDVIPIPWKKEILEGKRKAVISRQK